MTTTHTPDPDGLLDETYERMRSTGPEFDGCLSNHGPMAADALIRMGCQDQVEGWTDRYAERLEAAPDPRWRLDAAEWREALGDASRLGDWIAFFDEQLADGDWESVLVRWWPRLVDGAIASATHGLIRTGHAVRALREAPGAARLHELAQALGYWAARHQRLPDHPRPAGRLAPSTALGRIHGIDVDGGIVGRLEVLARDPEWPSVVRRVQPPADADGVPAAIDALVDAAVSRYRDWAHANPVMLVHAATAPRAAGLVLPALPEELWIPTFDAAWACTAAISRIYRSSAPAPDAGPAEAAVATPDEVVEHATRTADEHAIKLAEVALESHRRGNPAALAAGARAARLIEPVDGS